MFGQKKGPFYEILSFGIDHGIIFWVGIIFIGSITLYFLFNIHKLKLDVIIESIILIGLSWSSFYIVIVYGINMEPTTAIAAVNGIILPLIVWRFVKRKKNNQ